MSALVVLPDVERLLKEFLRDQPEVDDIVAGRVWNDVPDAPHLPCVRVAKFGGTLAPVVRRWATSLCQVDIYGRLDLRSEVRLLAELCAAALQQRLPGTHIVGSAGCHVNAATPSDITFGTEDGLPTARFDVSVICRPIDEIDS